MSIFLKLLLPLFGACINFWRGRGYDTIKLPKWVFIIFLIITNYYFLGLLPTAVLLGLYGIEFCLGTGERMYAVTGDNLTDKDKTKKTNIFLSKYIPEGKIYGVIYTLMFMSLPQIILSVYFLEYNSLLLLFASPITYLCGIVSRNKGWEMSEFFTGFLYTLIVIL